MQNNEQFLGFNLKAWNFASDKIEGWQYVEYVNFKNGWITVKFNEEKEFKERVARKNIPAQVKKMVGRI